MIVATIAGVCLPGVTTAQPFGEEQKLNANDAVAGIGFGDAVALDGERAVVGATANGVANLSAGAVYVLEWNASASMWEHRQKLEADDGELDDRFGWSVDLDGDALIVGAPDDADNGNRSGSAYVFRREGDTWVQEQKLLPDDGDANDRFGRSVAISDDVAIVGAPSAEGSGGPTGAAYTFHFDGESWVQQQKIQVGTFSTIAGLGAAVSVFDDRVLIGVPRAGPGAQNLGSAYVFRFDDDQSMWVEEDVLSASDEDPQDMFGSSVDLHDDIALIGVHQDSEGAAVAGAAYVFRWDGESWQEEVKLLADDAGEGDHFGTTVSIRGNTAAVGSPDDDHDGGLSAGSVYVFEFEGGSWTQAQKLTASDAGIGDHFGESLALDSDRLLIGASNADDGGESTGSAYVFRRGAPGTAIEDAPEVASTLAVRTYPNPFRRGTNISYSLPESGTVDIEVFDILGRRAEHMALGRKQAGEHVVRFETDLDPAGPYIVRIRSNESTATTLLIRIE
ncbi:MAG TPA: T9SS type A sorting domain-containing protein [Rhodothermales bacterium]|nr:T9SS type A sorting domain-containing protein [Rhodothermales bacterium]